MQVTVDNAVVEVLKTQTVTITMSRDDAVSLREALAKSFFNRQPCNT